MNRRFLPTRHILLVEDNPDDIFLMKMAFEESTVPNHLHVVEDGEEALNFLRKKNPYSQSPRPHLILLDLNLPRIKGLDVLEQIKLDNDLKDIPVMILTTSNYEDDILKSYQRYANSYITKPVDFDDFIKMIRFIEHFWFNVVTLPPHDY